MQNPFPCLAAYVRGPVFATLPQAGRPLIHETGHSLRACRVFAAALDSHVVGLTGGFPAEVFR